MAGTRKRNRHRLQSEPKLAIKHRCQLGIGKTTRTPKRRSITTKSLSSSCLEALALVLFFHHLCHWFAEQGTGKGTQCAKLVQRFGFCHLSGRLLFYSNYFLWLEQKLAAGDLLRSEQNREGSEYGELIRTNIREGTIVPMEVTIKLLENAMRAAIAENREGEGWADDRGRFLVDGFPRKMDQADKFEEDVRN